ncbi:Segregation and condensation protein B [bacterium HR36]|nr:Segregation and condensation protein B [bacterium HR36]
MERGLAGRTSFVLPYQTTCHLRDWVSKHAARRRPLREPCGDAAIVAGPFARDASLALVEAVLFIADEPITPKRLAEVAGLRDAAEARRVVRQLQSLLEAEGSAFQVQAIAGGYQLTTLPQYRPWLARLRQTYTDLRLSAAAKETLAIIAYRQPITRAEIEAIRGVQCADMLRLLMERGLIRIVGRQNTLGRPVLYGTTRKFLQLLGLNRIEDLPRAAELRQSGHIPQQSAAN